MNGKTYTVGAFAKLTGVTVRTLRFYHKKGLLEPSGYNEQGHRLYADGDLIRLQQILTLKFLDYPLEKIARELEADEGELRRSLERQAKLLREKKEQLDRMLHTLDYTLELTDGGEIQWEPSVLLLLIRSVATEKEQRRWMEEKLPASLRERFWPKGDELGSWRRIEQEAVRWISRLKKLMREERSPDDPEAQRFVAELSQRLAGLMSRLELPLSAEEIRDLEAFGRLEPPHALQLPVMFTAEEERFIERMWEAAADGEADSNEAAGTEKGGDSDGN